MPKKICHAHVSSLKHHHHITATRPSPLPLSMTNAPMMTMWILGTPPRPGTTPGQAGTVPPQVVPQVCTGLHGPGQQVRTT